MVQVTANCTGFSLDGEEKEWSEVKRLFKEKAQHTHKKA